MVLLAVGAVQMVNGLALLRRNGIARPVLVISSSLLLIPSVTGLAAGGMGIVPLMVVVPSLWLTLSTRGKEAFQSYMARANG